MTPFGRTSRRVAVHSVVVFRLAIILVVQDDCFSAAGCGSAAVSFGADEGSAGGAKVHV